jgi:hypothetical protein
MSGEKITRAMLPMNGEKTTEMLDGLGDDGRRREHARAEQRTTLDLNLVRPRPRLLSEGK